MLYVAPRVAKGGADMDAPFSDLYWDEEFQVTEADLDRIADHIQETKQAYELTALARRLVRGRLRDGPDRKSVPVHPERVGDASVRLWDPAGEWKEGDHAYVCTWSRLRGDEVKVGEVTSMDDQHVFIVVEDDLKKFCRAGPHSPNAVKWHQTVVRAIEELKRGTTESDRIEHTVLKHGERIMSPLLDALKADQRFIRLAGRWYLRQLAVSPTDKQLASLAWAMVTLEEGKSTSDLVPLIQPSLAQGDSGLFGLYQAMRGSELFENEDPGKRPRWILVGPPPGTCTARHAAYDPEGYDVLCLPGKPISPEVVERLWETGLLEAVIESS